MVFLRKWRNGIGGKMVLDYIFVAKWYLPLALVFTIGLGAKMAKWRLATWLLSSFRYFTGSMAPRLFILTFGDLKAQHNRKKAMALFQSY